MRERDTAPAASERKEATAAREEKGSRRNSPTDQPSICKIADPTSGSENSSIQDLNPSSPSDHSILRDRCGYSRVRIRRSSCLCCGSCCRCSIVDWRGTTRCFGGAPARAGAGGNSTASRRVARCASSSSAIQMIRRRYFSNELPAPSPWSLTPREDTILPVETVNDEELFKRKSYGGQRSKYNGVVPLPAQRNLTPALTLYPQQPMSSSENYRYHRFSASAIPDVSSSTPSRLDINL